MLKVKQIKKQYGTFTLECSMEVLPGQITGLIGKNGAGKSTTFKAILGLIKPDQGEIEVFGKDVAALTPEDWKGIGVVMGGTGFNSFLSIRSISRILRNLYEDFDESVFFEKCGKFGLPLDKKVKEFSTGMLAKLKLLTTLSHRSKLLILDEPTVGLDVVARDELLDLLRDYMAEDENRSVLISSHISTDLESLCDNIYMIHEGRIIFHEDTDVLLGEYAVLKMSEERYQRLDREYILRTKKEGYGYRCLTNQKQFYMENEPDLVLEKGSIDEVILMMGGKAE